MLQCVYSEGPAKTLSKEGWEMNRKTNEGGDFQFRENGIYEGSEKCAFIKGERDPR